MNETTRQLPASFGPKPGALERREIRRQMEALGERLEARAMALDPQGSHNFASMSRTLANILVSPNPGARQAGADLTCKSLLDVGERDDPAFWASDLGRAIAREVGWIRQWPSRMIARHVLNVSRQAIDQMIQRGDLDAVQGHVPPAVTRHSLQKAAAKRWPYESDTV